MEQPPFTETEIRQRRGVLSAIGFVGLVGGAGLVVEGIATGNTLNMVCGIPLSLLGLSLFRDARNL